MFLVFSEGDFIVTSWQGWAKLNLCQFYLNCIKKYSFLIRILLASILI